MELDELLGSHPTRSWAATGGISERRSQRGSQAGGVGARGRCPTAPNKCSETVGNDYLPNPNGTDKRRNRAALTYGGKAVSMRMFHARLLSRNHGYRLLAKLDSA